MSRVVRIASRALAALTLAIVAGCASSATTDGSSARAAAFREPYLIMSSVDAGVLVWPSEEDWLLLSTVDGFAHVTNRTPLGVDTSGGLSVALDGQSAAAAVGPYDRLLRSPVMIARAPWRWQPTQPQGAVSSARGSVAITADATYVVVSGNGGTLLRRVSDGPWLAVTSGSRLSGASGVTLDAVSWSGQFGVVAGHAAVGGATAYLTRDDGVHWAAVPGTAGRSVAALPACGNAPDWLVPVVDASGELRVVTAAGTIGSPVAVGSGDVALGCSNSDIMVVDRTGELRVSDDGGRGWRTVSHPPDGLTALALTGADSGYATSGGSTPKLWRFSSAGAHFARVSLPSWVATLGGQGATN